LKLKLYGFPREPVVVHIPYANSQNGSIFRGFSLSDSLPRGSL
jgi:hypothetical protein